MPSSSAPQIPLIESLPTELENMTEKLAFNEHRSTFFAWFWLVVVSVDSYFHACGEFGPTAPLLALVPYINSWFNTRLEWSSTAILYLITGLELLMALNSIGSLKKTPWGWWFKDSFREVVAFTRLSPSTKPRISTEDQGNQKAVPLLALGAIATIVFLIIKSKVSVMMMSLPASEFNFRNASEAYPIILSILISWLVAVIATNAKNDRGVATGIAVGVLFTALGYIFSGASHTTPNQENIPDAIRWCAFAVLIFVILYLLLLSFESPNTWKTRPVAIGNNSSWLRVSLPDLRDSFLPPLKYRIQPSQQSILLLREDREGNFRFQDIRDVLMPTLNLYEILNLSALAQQKELFVDAVSSDNTFMLRITFVARVLPPEARFERKEISKIVLAGPPTRQIIQLFFQSGHGQIQTLPHIMTELLSQWLGEDFSKVGRLLSRCSQLARSIELGTELPTKSNAAVITQQLINSLESAYSQTDLAKQGAIARAKQIGPAQLELMDIEREFGIFLARLAMAKKEIGSQFNTLLTTAIEARYKDIPIEPSMRESYRRTIAMMLATINLEIVSTTWTELAPLSECRAKIKEVGELIVRKNEVNVPLADALKESSATLLTLFKETIDAGMLPNESVQKFFDYYVSGASGREQLRLSGLAESKSYKPKV